MALEEVAASLAVVATGAGSVALHNRRSRCHGHTTCLWHHHHRLGKHRCWHMSRCWCKSSAAMAEWVAPAEEMVVADALVEVYLVGYKSHMPRKTTLHSA